MQIGDVFGDYDALGVHPRTFADAVACVYGWLTRGGRGAEVRPPRPVAGAGGCGQRLTVFIRSGESTEICAVARADARDEETDLALLCRHTKRRDGNEECCPEPA